MQKKSLNFSAALSTVCADYKTVIKSGMWLWQQKSRNIFENGHQTALYRYECQSV